MDIQENVVYVIIHYEESYTDLIRAFKLKQSAIDYCDTVQRETGKLYNIRKVSLL